MKLDAGFTHRESLVTDGHKMEIPPSMKYAYVVSRDSVIIALLIDVINVLDVRCVDVYMPTSTPIPSSV